MKPQDRPFARVRRQAAWTWLALLVLMFTSLGSAYLPLGPANLVIGLVVAAVKAALVAWIFMGLRDASGLVRVAAAVGLAAWLVLATLSGVDYFTRPDAPAAVQVPRQLPPLRDVGG